MATEEYSIGYEDGKSAGFDECMAQQRTWVRLTDEQCSAMRAECSVFVSNVTLRAMYNAANGIAPKVSDK